MIKINYLTSTSRHTQLLKYTDATGLTVNEAISTMIDDFLCRQLLVADEASVPVPRSQDST
jgi:hypothetical protein